MQWISYWNSFRNMREEKKKRTNLRNFQTRCVELEKMKLALNTLIVDMNRSEEYSCMLHRDVCMHNNRGRNGTFRSIHKLYYSTRFLWKTLSNTKVTSLTFWLRYYDLLFLYQPVSILISDLHWRIFAAWISP